MEFVRKEMTISACIFAIFTYSITYVAIVYSDCELTGKKKYHIWMQIFLLYEISACLNYSPAFSDNILQGLQKFRPTIFWSIKYFVNLVGKSSQIYQRTTKRMSYYL